MSTNKTENYQLHLWEPGDNFLREEFNENNEMIDAALDNLAQSAVRIARGTYVGTGTHSESTPNTLTFGFEPKLLCIDGQTAWGNGATQGWAANHNGYSALTWNGNTVSWYAPNNSYLQVQFNDKGTTYHYLAIG